MQYFSVTVTSAYDNAVDYEPRTAVFSTRDAAEGFKNDLEALFEEFGCDDLLVTIDSGAVDSTLYMEYFQAELCADDEGDDGDG